MMRQSTRCSTMSKSSSLSSSSRSRPLTVVRMSFTYWTHTQNDDSDDDNDNNVDTETKALSSSSSTDVRRKLLSTRKTDCMPTGCVWKFGGWNTVAFIMLTLYWATPLEISNGSWRENGWFIVLCIFGTLLIRAVFSFTESWNKIAETLTQQACNLHSGCDSSIKIRHIKLFTSKSDSTFLTRYSSWVLSDWQSSSSLRNLRCSELQFSTSCVPQ